MPVGAGKFQLYSKIDPVLAAGDYRHVVTQTVEGNGGDASSIDIATHHAHVRVRAPRYQLPPDQVLSTFPPAAAEGSFGARLPQIVIKRRTLPWERDLAGQPSSTPWLALVVIAEGEAELKLNQPVAECVTPGVTLGGVADSALGSSLHVRRSVVHRVFPTQLDVPLLAHAREVDINDTELMMGDDDGFLSVVVANRLPLAGVDADGNERPVKYLACLINLEGQFERLLPEAPPDTVIDTSRPIVQEAMTLSLAQHDQLRMEAATTFLADADVVLQPRRARRDEASRGGARDAALGEARGFVAHELGEVQNTRVVTTGSPAFSGDATWTLEASELVASNAYVEMALDFAVSTQLHPELIDPTYRFPVLLHWSFVSSGSTTFKQLMTELDSGLIGTTAEDAPAPDGRPPLEVVETGHVGLVHRTRRGDQVRCWYRGPLVPHPPEGDEERLPLAHVADQLRTVIPDGREDLSLSSAFEIGRLLALSHPSMVAAMLQWRQRNYHVARRGAIWSGHEAFLDELVGADRFADIAAVIGLELGRGLVRKLTTNPDDVIGGPRELIDPGRPLTWDRPAADVVAAGFGLERGAFEGRLDAVLTRLVRLDRLPGESLDIRLETAEIRDQLHRVVDRRLVDLTSNTLDLDLDLDIDPGGVSTGPGGVVTGPGGVVTGPGGVVTGPGGVVTGPGGVVTGPGGIVSGPGGIFGPTVPGTVLRGGGPRPFAERFAPLLADEHDDDVEEDS